LTFPRQESTKLYKRESNPKIKERLLLVLKVEGDGIIPAHAADEPNRSRPWALYWLERFSNEGIDGLKDRSKSGRPLEIPKELAISIRKELLESKQGWTTTKQVRDIIFREGWSKIEITTLTSTEYFTSGVSNRSDQVKCTSIQLQLRKKKISKNSQGYTGHSTRRIYNSIIG
jgi:transposase